MSLNAWTRELGTNQGRIAPTGATPSQGTRVFCLGFDRPGRFEDLALNDYVEVSQTATLTAGTKLIRATFRLRPPTAVPAGTRWRFSLRIDGTEKAFQILTPGRVRDRLTLAANVTQMSGSHTVAFRLQLVAG